MADERASGTTRRRVLAGAVGPLGGAGAAGAAGAAGLAGVLALACAPGDQAGRAAGEGVRLKTGVRLLAIGWGGPPAAQARGSIVEQFMRQYPGITAEYSDLAGGNPYFDKLRADLAAGTPPDVFFMNPYNFTLYAVQKALLNLAPLIKRDRTDLSDFYPVALQLFGHRGNQTGMPLHFNGINLAFNKAAFQTINQPFPSQSLKGQVWGFDQFLETCRRLARRQGDDVQQWGTSINTSFQWYLSFVYANGGDLVNKDQTACLLTEAAAVDALQYLQDLALKHRVAALPADLAGAGLNLNTAFTTGRTAMFWPSGAPQFGTIRPAAQFDWDVGILPVGRGKPATGMGAPGYCLPREARNPDEAWALVNALSGKEAQLGEVTAGTITPSRKSVAFSPEFLNQRPPEHTRVVSETLETIKLPPQLANWTDFQTALDGEMAPLWAGTKTAREATLATKQQLDPLLREARRLEEAAR
jgi:multiple sugar transport system substrate-binding protein